MVLLKGWLGGLLGLLPFEAKNSPICVRLFRLDWKLIQNTHHRRLHIGPDSDRNPPNAYNPDAAKKHFKEHLIPQVG